MARITDIEGIRDSLNKGSVRIGFDAGDKITPIEIKFSLNDKENDRIYDFINNYLMVNEKMRVYFVFRDFKKFARLFPLNMSSYVALWATGVEQTCSTVQVPCVLAEIMEDIIMEDISYDDFFDAVNNAEWRVGLERDFGSRYIELKEI